MMTGVGMLLGTAAYMSPEQARGKTVDKRSDIWAFGSVLYEVLTGTRAFAGDDVSDTLAFILTKEPDWTALPANTPFSIKKLLRRCLEKDRKRRLADIADVRFEIEEGLTAPAAERSSVTPSTTVTAWARGSRRAVMAASIIAGALAVGGATTWFATRQVPQTPFVTRLTISPPGASGLTINGTDRDLAITPDGSRVVYVGNNGTQLFVRALDALEPVAIFKGAPRGPFVSPDGQWVGFVDNNTVMKKVAITGGPAVTLSSTDSSTPRGAAWSQDDTIVYATANATTGLQRVPAVGGSPSVLTRPDRTQGEQDHLWPEMLPGGSAVLFTITAQTGGPDASQVGLLNLQTGTRKVLVRGGSHAHYVPGGYLVYAAAGVLRVVGLDLERLEVRGTPVPVVAEVAMTAQGGVDAVVAANGTLAYVSGGAAGVTRRLVWVNRQGQETPIPAPPRTYVYPRLAPDNSSVMLYMQDQDSDIWLWSLARTTLTRVTFDPSIEAYPVWTPDGRGVIFSSERSGTRNLFWQAADGTGAVERLTESLNQQNALSVCPDGACLIFLEAASKTGDDIMQLRLDSTRRVTPLIQTPFSERNAVISPDGRWIAYEANSSGQSEVYVRPYPDVNGGQWLVSTGGGTRPLWSPNSQELFYVAPSGAIWGVGVERTQSWAATAPTTVLKAGYVTSLGGNPGRTYDISADGQRFLMIKSGDASDPTTPPANLIVVQNWTEELKRLVPAE
jgi:serine/threonine-protein kinase